MLEPSMAVEPDTMQEGNWMEEVKLNINQEAEGVSLTIPPFFRRFHQSDNEVCPSIFKPRRQVALAAPMPMIAQAAVHQPQDHTGAAARRGSPGGNVIIIAVGPYHHCPESESQPPLITHAKKCAIVNFLARPEFGLDVADFLSWARHNDARARRHYERDSFTMQPKELAKMLLLDGCLLLFAVFLLGSRGHEHDNWLTAELVRSPVWEEFVYLSSDISLHKKSTRLDLLLLGNQIPFFLIAELHRRLVGTFFKGIQYTIRELALSCFDDICPSPSPSPSTSLRFPPTVHHLLHLFHWSRVPQAENTLNLSSILLGEPKLNLPNATSFADYEISLSNHAAPGSSALHIVFERTMLGLEGVLRIPKLHIHGYSELVFRNLIAFEQSHLRCGLDVTVYSICMARLLQNTADAKLLRDSWILVHTQETDKEIVDLFSGLADEYHGTFHTSYLLDLCKDVEVYQKSIAAWTIREAKIFLRLCCPIGSFTFFVILGAFISIATLANAIYSIYRFYHPVKQ